MYLKALSTSVAVPCKDFDATIHSVFHSALNLRLTRGGKLLTLVKASEADLPQGIRVDTPADFSFDIFHIDEPVRCRDNILRLPSLTIELCDSRLWKCDLPTMRVDMQNPAVAHAWQRAWQMLNERQIQLNAEVVAEDLFCSDETIKAGVPRRMGAALRNLVNTTLCCDLPSTLSIRALIGLGAGLTPSGDDLLAGYLAGLGYTHRDQRERIQYIFNLGKAVVRFYRQTNDISRTYLYHAVRGQFSSRLADLAEAISHGQSSAQFVTALNSAMQVGHTSGMDAVTGLLVGLAAWDSPETLFHDLRVRLREIL